MRFFTHGELTEIEGLNRCDEWTPDSSVVWDLCQNARELNRIRTNGPRESAVQLVWSDDFPEREKDMREHGFECISVEPVEPTPHAPLNKIYARCLLVHFRRP